MVVLQDAEKLKAQGVDVADFGPGEPDFPTPEHIKRAASRRSRKIAPSTRRSPASRTLRQAICDWHAAQLGSSYQPSECVVNVGGKHSIFNAVCSLINPGDEVIIAAPYWVSYPDIVKYAGGTPVFVETLANDYFILRASKLEKALTPHTTHGDRQFAQQSHRRCDSAGRIRAGCWIYASARKSGCSPTNVIRTSFRRRQAIFHRQPFPVRRIA